VSPKSADVERERERERERDGGREGGGERERDAHIDIDLQRAKLISTCERLNRQICAESRSLATH
jgi:hypothetical protein